MILLLLIFIYGLKFVGWWFCYWCWVMLLVVLLVLVGVGGVVVWSVLCWSEVVCESLLMCEVMCCVGCSIELVEVFGELLCVELMLLGSMQIVINGQCDVGLIVVLEGLCVYGWLFVKGICSDGVWDYLVMYVLGENKQMFDLIVLDDDEVVQECELQVCCECGECLLVVVL